MNLQNKQIFAGLARQNFAWLFYLILILAAPTILCGVAFAQTQCPECPVEDSMVFETYYPSPYGTYDELRGNRIIVGDTEENADSRIFGEANLPPPGTLTFDPKSSAEISNLGKSYEGTIYYDKNENKFKYYDNNSSWQDLGGGGGGAYWDKSSANSDDIYYTQSGNVGIGMGASDTIGAKLQINTGDLYTKGIVLKTSIDAASAKSTYTYNFIDNKIQTFEAITDATITITVYGAQGGGSYGGLGGMAKADFSVNRGDKLYIYVGGRNGYNGGGGGCPPDGIGGGASDVRRGGYSLDNRIIVAGGGGGGGGSDGGGSGGGEIGSNGAEPFHGSGNWAFYSAKGGTQSEGGAGGGGNGCNGQAGTKGSGGNGAYGSGGGGGYYGGGGSGGCGCTGGAGGSGYVQAKTFLMQSGVRSGDGLVIIEVMYISPVPFIELQNMSGEVLSVVDGKGRIGIGVATPSAYLDIAAGKTTIADSWSTRSSLRFKEKLYPVDNALTKLTSLQGVYFDYKDSHKHSLGLVAEDVGRVFPELVTYEPNGTDAVGLDYDKLNAVTIEAVKEQQKEIEDQRREIRQLKDLLKETSRNQQKEIDLLKAEKKER